MPLLLARLQLLPLRCDAVPSLLVTRVGVTTKCEDGGEDRTKRGNRSAQAGCQADPEFTLALVFDVLADQLLAGLLVLELVLLQGLRGGEFSLLDDRTEGIGVPRLKSGQDGRHGQEKDDEAERSLRSVGFCHDVPRVLAYRVAHGVETDSCSGRSGLWPGVHLWHGRL